MSLSIFGPIFLRFQIFHHWVVKVRHSAFKYIFLLLPQASFINVFFFVVQILPHRIEEFDVDGSYLQTSTLCGEFEGWSFSSSFYHLKYPGCVKSSSLFTFTFNDFKRKALKMIHFRRWQTLGKSLGPICGSRLGLKKIFTDCPTVGVPKRMMRALLTLLLFSLGILDILAEDGWYGMGVTKMPAFLKMFVKNCLRDFCFVVS